jgi:hypothetical protein
VAKNRRVLVLENEDANAMLIEQKLKNRVIETAYFS